MKVKIRISGNWDSRDNISMKIYIGRKRFVKLKCYYLKDMKLKKEIFYLTWIDIMEIINVYKIK